MELPSIEPVKGLFRRSPAIKAVVLLSAAMVFALALATVLLLVDLQKRELTHAKGEIVSLGRVLAEQTTRAFDGVTLSMRGARERLSDDLGRNLDLSAVPVRLLLLARISGLPQVKSMFVVDRDGMVVNSSRKDFQAPFSVANRDFFRHFAADTKDELFISQPERARLDNQWTYYLSLKLLDSSGEFRGVLVSAMNIEYFESLYESISLDFVSQISLLNLDGLLMAGLPEAHGELGRAIANSAALAEIATQAEREWLSDNNDPAGERWFTSYHMVNNYPLVVSPAVNATAALGPWRRVAVPILVGVGFITCFILISTAWAIRSLHKQDDLESALKESDIKLRHMVQSVRDAIVTVDASGSIVLFNAAAERLFSLPMAETVGKSIGEVLLQSQPKSVALDFMRRIRELGTSPDGLIDITIVSLAKGDAEIPIELSLSGTIYRGEQLFTAVFRDLSERQKAEYELAETNRQLHALAAAQQNVREEERLRISRELHDELGQSLTGIKMEVSWLGSRLAAIEPTLEKKVVSIKNLIDEGIASIRRISSELRPLVLDDLGFSAAAKWYVAQFSGRTGINVDLRLSDNDPENGSAIATTLFRVLQESLTNIARHAGAAKVEIQLGFSENCWNLSVRDDGCGIDEARSSHVGIGLIGMKERVQILGGTFKLASTPGQGVLISVQIPAELAT